MHHPFPQAAAVSSAEGGARASGRSWERGPAAGAAEQQGRPSLGRSPAPPRPHGPALRPAHWLRRALESLPRATSAQGGAQATPTGLTAREAPGDRGFLLLLSELEEVSARLVSGYLLIFPKMMAFCALRKALPCRPENPFSSRCFVEILWVSLALVFLLPMPSGRSLERVCALAANWSGFAGQADRLRGRDGLCWVAPVEARAWVHPGSCGVGVEGMVRVTLVVLWGPRERGRSSNGQREGLACGWPRLAKACMVFPGLIKSSGERQPGGSDEGLLLAPRGCC